MKKFLLASAVLAASSPAFSQGIFGNHVLVGFALPSYSDWDSDTAHLITIKGSLFVSDELYLVGTHTSETIGFESETSSAELTMQAKEYSFGAGYETPINKGSTNESALYGELRLSNVSLSSLMTQPGYESVSYTADASAYTASGGIRSRSEQYVSEVALNLTKITFDDLSSESSFGLSSMAGYEVSDKLAVGVSAFVDLDFDFSSIGVFAAVKF